MELKKTFNNWFVWGLLSIAIVALYGTLMRYKIAFSFPFFDQKFLQHAHSHFAFSGWISHLLYCRLFMIVSQHINPNRYRMYKGLINANLLAAFGMLIAFTAEGYKATSITFSTLTIVIAIVFCVRFFKDAKPIPRPFPAIKWAKYGLLLNILSALGPFTLAYIMISKNTNTDFYLSSIYYYLHFQYNGWFFFGTMAVAISLLPQHILSFDKYFKVFAVTAIPTYILSTLWAKPPLWLYIITIIATLAQLFAWIHLLVCFFKKRKSEVLKTDKLSGFLFYCAALALSIKFLLQAISVIPSLSQLVFGFRPIVIAYLHLVLLGVFSLFLIADLMHSKLIIINKITKATVIAFFIGVLFNEALLGIQGVAAFTYTLIPFINEALFVAACVLLLSSGGLLLSQFIQHKKLKSTIPYIRAEHQH